MRSRQKLVTLLIVLMLIPMAAFAHSGRTDSSGGHKDNKNKSGLGSYHYHCGGNPAHLHTNGCPYSSTSSSKKTTPKPTPVPTPRPTPKPVIDRDMDGVSVDDAEFEDANLPLEPGDKSEWVKRIQQRLKDLNYLFDKADGVYGKKTKAAVEAFQLDNDFEVNGIVDRAVYIALMYWTYEE